MHSCTLVLYRLQLQIEEEISSKIEQGDYAMRQRWERMLKELPDAFEGNTALSIFAGRIIELCGEDKIKADPVNFVSLSTSSIDEVAKKDVDLAIELGRAIIIVLERIDEGTFVPFVHYVIAECLHSSRSPQRSIVFFLAAMRDSSRFGMDTAVELIARRVNLLDPTVLEGYSLGEIR